MGWAAEVWPRNGSRFRLPCPPGWLKYGSGRMGDQPWPKVLQFRFCLKRRAAGKIKLTARRRGPEPLPAQSRVADPFWTLFLEGRLR